MNPQKQHTLPEGWEMKKLGEIVEKSQYGLSVPTTDDGEIPMFKMNNFKNGKMIPEGVDKVNLEYEELKKYCLNDGDILFNRTNSAELVGKTGIFDLPGEYTFASYLVRFVINRKMAIPEFINAYFNWERSQSYFKELATKGVSQSNINPTNLQKFFFVDLPPLPEQRRIAAVLSTWDTGIEQTGELINALRARHRGLMHQLLTGKVRLPGFGGEWRSVKLGEVFKERNQSGYHNLPLLSITAERGVINRDELEKRDTSNEDKSKYKRICVGDIGYNTMRMWQGRSAVSSLEGIVSPAYTIVTPKEGTDVQYMGHLFKLPEMIHRFYRNSQGLVDDTLNCKFPEFAKVRVAIPSTIQEQRAIAQVLDASLKEIQQQEVKLEALREQKRGLMQCLLTGRVRVPAA